MHAGSRGHMSTIKFLIENGADIHACYDEAVRYDNFSAVEFLENSC